MNGKPKRPWRMLAPLAASLVVFLLWSGYWLVANSTAQKYAALYRDQLAERGFSFVCDAENWGGYPFRIEFTCEKPVINFPGGRSFRSQALFAVAQAYDPTHVIVLADGPSKAVLPNNEIKKLAHGQAVVSIVARSGGTSISAEIPNFDSADVFAAENIQLHTRPAADGGNDIALTITGAVYRPFDQPPLMIDRAQALGTLKGEVIDITEMQIAQGNVKLWGKGAAHLDAAHRIAGQIEVQTNDLKGLFQIIDPYISLSQQDRAALLTLLGLFGQGAKAPLVARDGDIYLGPVKLGELAPLY
ncbi:MAG: DUF2125 domain-containing protein [Aestuariivirga sp.]